MVIHNFCHFLLPQKIEHKVQNKVWQVLVGNESHYQTLSFQLDQNGSLGNKKEILSFGWWN